MPQSRSRSPSSRPRYPKEGKEDKYRKGEYGSRDRRRRSRSREGSSGSYNRRTRDRDEREEYRDRDRRKDYGRDDRRRDRDRDRDRERDGGRDRDRERNRERSERDDPNSRRRTSRSASPEDKSKPNFANSGLLAAATNTVKHSDGTTTLLKYNEPPEARKPSQGWRLYAFKGEEDLGLLHIDRQSAYLIGRDHLIADIALDHPSCSKQHAAIQFRQVQAKDEWGAVKAVVKPFIIDLESTNGTHVNGETIPPSRYYELKIKDVIKFGQSVREYVLLHEDV